MDLGLNLLFLVPGETGGREVHTRGLLSALRRAEPDLRVTAFVGRDGVPIDGVDRLIRLPVDPQRPAGWAVGETVLVAGAASRAGVELLHSPANFGPPRGAFARVLTVHDVGYRTQPGARSTATHALVRAAARGAHEVIAVSETSRADVIKELGVSPNHVTAIPNGITPVPAGFERRPSRSILCVATNLPHKDLATAVAARERLPEPRPKLVIAGKGTAPLGGLGAVSHSALDRLYEEAGVLVVPSRYEGFGIPLIEAFARGIPVVCSDLPVLREVAGDLATFVAPGDVDGFAAAITATLDAPPDVAALKQHAARFTWDAAASATLAVYRRALTQAAR